MYPLICFMLSVLAHLASFLLCLGVSDPAEDGAACSVGEMNHGTCSDH